MWTFVVLLAVAPIAPAERQAVSEVAARLARSPASENATWTLRKASEGVAFEVRWPDGRIERVLLGPKAPAAAVAGHAEARPALLILGAFCIAGAIFIRKLRLILIAAALALGIVGALPYVRRAPPPSAKIAAPKVVRDDELLEKGDYAAMRAMGTRDAEAYYREGTFDAFRLAWQLDPKPREELVRDGTLMDDLRTKALISYYAPTEPVVRSRVLATAPIDWPRNAKAFVSGEKLRVEIGSAAIVVPNGAALAPKDAQVVPATFEQERNDALALAEANRGTASIRAISALARHNRWSDVLKLTERETPDELLHVRIRALLRAGRVEDARRLAETRHADDEKTRIAIADAMSNAGQWSVAETLFRSAGNQDLKLRQLELRRALATNAQSIATRHFDIRHDASINPAVVSRIGDLLEAELARVQTRLLQTPLRRVTVNVLHWEDFRRDITNSDHILGLYDGEILFPFASVERFQPEVVAVITHELTHAVLAQATHDNAPRWFQEGVAARMELVPRQENAFATTPNALVLPVTLLDAVMERSADPDTYVVAQTFIRFLEDRYGANAIAQLANEFAKGTNSDDALMKLAGKSLDALNADFRQWGFHHNGEFVNDEPWPYRDWYSPGIDPRIRGAFKFGVRQP